VRSAERSSSRRRGTALVLVLIGIVVVGGLAAAATASSVDSARAAANDADCTRAWYVAHAGLWAAADDLARHGAGDLDGVLGTSASLAATGAIDGDGDGWKDFTPLAAMQLRPDGAFEVRAHDEGPGLRRVRSRGVWRGTVRTLEAVLRAEVQGPFRWAALGQAGVSVAGSMITDSWNSDVRTFASTPITVSQGSTVARNHHGDVRSNTDVVVGGSSAVYGDANAVGTVTITGSGYISGQVGVTEPFYPGTPEWNVPGPDDPGVNNAAVGVAYGGVYRKGSGNATLPPGKYVFSSLELSGNAQLVVDVSAGDVEIFLTTSAGAALTLGTNSSLRPSSGSKTVGGNIAIYSNGGVDLGAQAALNVTGTKQNPVPGDPVKLQLYSDVGANGELALSGGSMASGVFYMPSAGSRLVSTANIQLFGSVLVDRFDSNGTASLHYDESLASFMPGNIGGRWGLYKPLVIRELR
jgi:hypothetical protein